MVGVAARKAAFKGENINMYDKSKDNLEFECKYSPTPKDRNTIVVVKNTKYAAKKEMEKIVEKLEKNHLLQRDIIRIARKARREHGSNS